MTTSPGGARPAVQQRSGVTRTRILDAAIRVLVERGYSGASTVAIQNEAGMSRGRLLHHYPSRDALLMAAVGHLARTRIEELPSRVDWPDDPIARISLATDVGWSTFHQPYFVASMELWVAARTNENLRTALLPTEREIGKTVREAVAGFLGPELTASPRYADLYPILFTSMRGAATTYLIDRRDPRTDPHLPLWKDMIRVYLVDK
ncbi:MULTISPECIES: TetR/AcrR family transcriptional regulator [Gordonia]|uniref:TetR/AcrR family transcriptional regulator n=1 Tax=Gordonia TaxID=2053 RepID=UPI000BB6DBAE|nr:MULTISPECIES: TetR/AcrR family transcriptional regulator [Gordonia]ATD71861.1 TetR family transcriptional regulator [Gordonia sp. 1D]MCR8896270.1 TetR/AcrR family transcriptional regulator [Gordonia sp. GONU]MCZ4650814.1 TetR/AcrR family transcriptional regulator [Gordonia amicalis]MDJ0451577.1 TetR/AcrR family transcriptional regulator [Gordonia amicalis]MDV7075733.1 TetR/AcrR family transcriptional regulator [Gordonia amicalis]